MCNFLKVEGCVSLVGRMFLWKILGGEGGG